MRESIALPQFDLSLPIREELINIHRRNPSVSGLMQMGAVLVFGLAVPVAAVEVEPGVPVRWQTATLTFDGPETSEAATPNPFLDYRMKVSFSHQQSGESRTAQGFFAADGNAAESSAESGAKWRVRFTPPLAGTWVWRAEFRGRNRHRT